MVIVKIYNGMEIELECNNLDEQRLFKNNYYARMVNFTGSDFGKADVDTVSTYVAPDFKCVSVTYDASKDAQVLTFTKADAE